ncbi:MAG: cyclic nucleotide-binding domain-containing protein [Mariprofundaceae bacterium]|nr:cyclic nucleotide-binding domain-containing protein [Mariprofundaceae bacterium]
MKQARVNLLQAMPVFGGVSQKTLEFLVDHSSIRSLSPGSYFFHEGDDAASMFVLERGKVAIYKQWSGEEHLLKHLSQGDCFGEMALLDLYPRSASVMAVEPCDAIELSQATLLRLYQHDLEQFTIIQMNIGREISRRLRSADNQLFQSGFSQNSSRTNEKN